MKVVGTGKQADSRNGKTDLIWLSSHLMCLNIEKG